MTRSNSRRPGVALPAVELVGLTVVAFLVSLVAGVAFIVPMFALGYELEATPVLLGATAAGQLAFLGVGYAYARFRDVAVTVRRPSLRELGIAAVGTVVALTLAVALSIVLSVLGLVPDSVIGEAASNDPTILLGLAVLSVFVVAPAEELLFRGAIQGRLRQRLGPVPAILGAGLLFGAMHLTNYAGAVDSVVAGATLVGIVGCVYGAMYELTDNLAVPVAAHAAYNVVLLLVSYAAA